MSIARQVFSWQIYFWLENI